MRFQSLAFLAGVTAVAADSTVTLFLPGFNAQSIEGKVIGSSGSTTTYLLNCPAGANFKECGLPADYTIAEGPSSVQAAFTLGEYSLTQSCRLQGTTFASCGATVDSSGSTSTLHSTITVSNIPYGGFQAVHVTATQTAGAGTGAGAGTSATTATATSTGTTTTTNGSGSSSMTASKTGSTNAAMPMITGNARWAVGGAAALALAVV